MFRRRGKVTQEVTAAIRQVEKILPDSGEVEDLLHGLSELRGRPTRLLRSALDQTVSGVLICTDQADYIAVSDQASPERACAIICHEVAHALLGHDHEGSLTSSLIDNGLLKGLDPKLAESVVAARQAYAHSQEADAELVATYISVELRRRVMRGGHTFYDDLWR